jgi:hypothetical protein
MIGFASIFGKRNRLLGPRAGACLIAAALFFSGGATGNALIPPGGYTPGGNAHGGYRILLAGQLLVASPGMRDPRFRETVILIIRHDESGAFGLIVNRPIGKVKLADLYRQFRLKPPPARSRSPSSTAAPCGPWPVSWCIPSSRGFRPASR